MTLSYEIILALASAAISFGAATGIYRERLRKSQSDLNGLGRKYGRMVALLIRWADTDVKRNQLADTVDPK